MCRCFLYIVHYARMKPEMALKALPSILDVRLHHSKLCRIANTDFFQDLADRNPFVRACALRTISYVHVKEYVEATVSPLKRLLKDSDPYVRKTAAICVAKLYDHDRNMVERSDLIERLNSLLRDENPTVIASALAALMDIWQHSDHIRLTLDYGNISNIVQIIPDCSE